MSPLSLRLAGDQGRLTSPCSRRAAARPGVRRGVDEPRPAAEGHLVRQFSPARRSRQAVMASVLLIAGLLGCATEATVATVRVAPLLQDADSITSVRLVLSGNGHSNTQWSRHLIEISRASTVSERDCANELKVRTEGRTSKFDWEHLCQFINDSRLFQVAGESDLGQGSHMLNAEATVTFDDGTQSKVSQVVWSDLEGPQLWPLIRIMEGCADNALPYAVSPESR